MPATRRLFVGLTLAEEPARRLVRRVHPTLVDDGGELPAGLTAYPAEDLHLTLAFLGEFPEEERPALQRTLQEELRGLDAPELTLSGTGAFPTRARPRVLWTGVEEAPECPGRLAALRNRAWQGAMAHGWRASRAERERPFRPHVTLARARPSAGHDYPAFFALDFDQRWLPVEAALIESRRGNEGPRYGVLAAVPLVVRPG